MRETWIEASGKTEDEAIANALSQIGLERDDVSVEILERAKAGFLGLGSTAAKVKVRYQTDEPEEAAPAAPVATSSPATPVAAPDVSAAAPSATTDAGQAASAFLEGLLERMGIVATLSVREEGDTLRIELIGDNMGQAIGRRGETLDAIQHLTSYAINKGRDGRTRVFLDSENYRAKREETLIRLANKTAEKVLRYRKNMGLEPMNAYERHIIHAALQDVPGVSTYSSGSDPNRRVFVAFDR